MPTLPNCLGRNLPRPPRRTQELVAEILAGAVCAEFDVDWIREGRGRRIEGATLTLTVLVEADRLPDVLAGLALHSSADLLIAEGGAA